MGTAEGLGQRPLAAWGGWKHFDSMVANWDWLISILEVRDKNPGVPLFAYRRIVVNVK